MSTFADTSVLYAAADPADSSTDRGREILRGATDLTTTDLVIAELWRLVRARRGWQVAEETWHALEAGGVELLPVRSEDLRTAIAIGHAFPGQEFSLVDRTSFAVMERLGITRVATFDTDFAVYRYGPRRERSFEILS